MRGESNTIIRRAIVAGSARIAGLAARSRFGAITSVRTDEPVAALTFDDGPHPEHTPALLTLLERHKARATFFMIGEVAQKNLELVRRVARAGHALGNHSWSHLSFPLLTRSECDRQLFSCAKVLSPYGEKLFRPPYCHLTLKNCWAIARAGHRIVAFNVHAEDWLDRDADWMAQRLIERIRPGCIVILHDNIYRSILPSARHDRKPMLDALRMALEALKGRIDFVTVPELLRCGPPVRELWRRQGAADLQPALHRDLERERQHASVCESERARAV
jgi:peptidoglycan/xylan/chitin deacetylase (PgdA/CDA1 family)